MGVVWVIFSRGIIPFPCFRVTSASLTFHSISLDSTNNDEFTTTPDAGAFLRFTLAAWQRISNSLEFARRKLEFMVTQKLLMIHPAELSFSLSLSLCRPRVSVPSSPTIRHSN